MTTHSNDTAEAAATSTRMASLAWLADLVASGPRGLLARQALTSSVGIFLSLSVTALYLVGPGGLGSGVAAASLTAASAASVAVTVPVGRLVHRLGARRFTLLSTYVRAVVLLTVPLAQPHWALVANVIAIGVAETAAFGVYQIIIAQTLGEAARTKALAARRSTLNLGFSVAAGLTAVVVGIGTPVAYLAAFLFSGGLLLASAWFIHALPSGPADRPDTEEPEVKVSPRSVLHDPRYLTLILVASFFATSLSLLTVGVPLWVVAHTHAPHAIVGLLMGTNTVLVMIFQVRLASRAETLKGARRAVAFGGFGFAIAAAVYAVAGRSPTLVTGPCASHALRVIPARDAYAQACAVLDPTLEDRPLTADIAAGVELLDSLSRI